MESRVNEVSQLFGMEMPCLQMRPFGTGHIHQTWLAEYQNGAGVVRYIHQCINTHVFPRPDLVMDNITRVLEHSRVKLVESGESDAARKALRVRQTQNGSALAYDSGGGCWRTYDFVDHTVSYDSVDQPVMARKAAQAFGNFQKLLLDLPGERLHETIPNFHDTPKRYQNLMNALELDPLNRASEIKDEVAFAVARHSDACRLLDLHAKGEIPERITHNDTKLNNVLFDQDSDEPICVVDLDTVMPGLILYDFGDMVRTTVNTGSEDEPDLSRVNVRMDLFEGLVEGYLGVMADHITPAERREMAFSGKLLALEVGMRFLTDHLEGDHYFKTNHPGHNLQRARAQFQLVTSLESKMDEMAKVVERY